MLSEYLTTTGDCKEWREDEPVLDTYGPLRWPAMTIERNKTCDKVMTQSAYLPVLSLPHLLPVMVGIAFVCWRYLSGLVVWWDSFSLGEYSGTVQCILLSRLQYWLSIGWVLVEYWLVKKAKRWMIAIELRDEESNHWVAWMDVVLSYKTVIVDTSAWGGRTIGREKKEKDTQVICLTRMRHCVYDCEKRA